MQSSRHATASPQHKGTEGKEQILLPFFSPIAAAASAAVGSCESVALIAGCQWSSTGKLITVRASLCALIRDLVFMSCSDELFPPETVAVNHPLKLFSSFPPAVQLSCVLAEPR